MQQPFITASHRLVKLRRLRAVLWPRRDDDAVAALLAQVDGRIAAAEATLMPAAEVTNGV